MDRQQRLRIAVQKQETRQRYTGLRAELMSAHG